MNEYFVCCELKQTTGEDIFKVVDEKVKEFGLNREKCISVYNDETSSMQGRKKGFVAHMSKY